MRPAIRQRIRLSGGAELSFITAGEASKPALLLLHGFPSSSRMFRGVISELSQAAYVIAPDLPGFGESDVLPVVSFAAFGQTISELLDRLGIGSRYVYLHDFGAPVGLHIAMQAPERVLGLIIQNANAHQTGFGPQWAGTLAYWSQPSPENEAAATAHLTFEGTRDQYIANVPPDVAARIPASSWEEDWRVMQLPGRMDTQRALIADYANYVARFDAIAEYLARRQPPALMLWGRHDAFFDLPETLSWMQALPRMEGHIFDAGHFVLETHAAVAGSLIVDFIRRTQRKSENGNDPMPATLFSPNP
ncbi:alpha/beta hydrolase [Mesorhizobium sp. BAC0120]|uniref:alpha/beta fold hydrolase n=1 Tax=Mesorhizobium sp. BAC0120 TaxID=3090670 RepID=UPI00298D436C|nr:alpha/beta hydrolase [Mesorhizobium sp. BAC0120]MDW6024337.1 alpha/beta hydrolase [Mesorhizobium sp. BAC0120]